MKKISIQRPADFVKASPDRNDGAVNSGADFLQDGAKVGKGHGSVNQPSAGDGYLLANPLAGQIISSGGVNMADGVELFEAFLRIHDARIGSIKQEDVTPRDLFGSVEGDYKLTGFKTIHDSLMYSMMIEELLKTVPDGRVSTMVDLGAGSSMPTIRALSRVSQHKNLKVIAVDIDTNALALSEHNATIAGMGERYQFVHSDMLTFLETIADRGSLVIAANPPYMPIPQDCKGDFYVPVDGGVDGTRYLEAILQAPMSSGTYVALRWCSLSNPRKIISLIEQNYDVLRIDAHRAPFGTYATLTKDYLIHQRSQGFSVFSTAQACHSFTFVSSILSRK